MWPLIHGMANVILAEGLENKTFIAERTEGLDAFRKVVQEWTPERAASVSGVPPELIVQAARLYAGAKAAAIFWAMGITQHTTGTDNVKALSNLALLCGQVGRPGTGLNPLRGQNNVQGACDMGGLPNVMTGYQTVTDEGVRKKFADGWGVPLERLSPKVGLTVTEMTEGALTGKIRAIFVLGENPMLSDPNLHHVEEALRKVDFLAVQDIFPNETAQFADVVLAGASFAEKEGTFTNTERRVQRVRGALPLPGEAREDWRVLTELGKRMGAGWNYASAAEVFDEMARLHAVVRRDVPCPARGGRAAVAVPGARPSGDTHPAHAEVLARSGRVRPDRISPSGGAAGCRVPAGAHDRPRAVPLAWRHDDPTFAGPGQPRPGSGSRDPSGRRQALPRQAGPTHPGSLPARPCGRLGAGDAAFSAGDDLHDLPLRRGRGESAHGWGGRSDRQDTGVQGNCRLPGAGEVGGERRQGC